MKISKYRIIDLIFSLLLGLMGCIGSFLIPNMQTYNVFLILYVLLNVVLFPICFFLLLKNTLPICSLIPLIFSASLTARLGYFEKENALVWNLVLVGQLISLLVAIVATVLIHSRKKTTKPQNTHYLSNQHLSTKMFFREGLFKRIFLFIRDALIVFFIILGILDYTNVAFDTSPTTEVEVVVVEMSPRNRKHNRMIYVEYSGEDPTVQITYLTVSNGIGDTISVGDKILLNYRKGFYKHPYFWLIY